jgi:TPR repeat protein
MKHIAIAAVMILLALPAWADYQDGVDAFDKGDYATALEEWRPLAEQGNASAQNALGYM